MKMNGKWYIEQPEHSDWMLPEGPDLTMGVEHYVMDNWMPLIGAIGFGIYGLLRAQTYRPGDNNSMNASDAGLTWASGSERTELLYGLAVLELCGLITLSRPSAEMWAKGVDRVIDLVLPPPKEPTEKLIEIFTGGHPKRYHRLRNMLHRSEGT